MKRDPNLPPLPPRLSRLGELATDLWWSWHPSTRAVFRRLDYGLWRGTAHNPVQMLALLSGHQLEVAASDAEFGTLYDEAISMLDAARAAQNTWWTAQQLQKGDDLIAYFSAEFALHQ